MGHLFVELFNIKKARFLMLVLLAIGFLYVGCAEAATPEKTVNTFLDAYEALDMDKALRLVVPEAAGERAFLETRFEVRRRMKWQGISFSYTNRNISVLSQTEDKATVSVSFDEETTVVMGGKKTKSVDETWTLVKRDGKWLFVEVPR